MLRTRNFLLLGVIALFLVFVFASMLFSSPSSTVVPADVQFVPADESPESFSGTVSIDPGIEREEKLRTMREKIAQSGLISAPEPEEEIQLVEDRETKPVESQSATSTLEQDEVLSAQLCSNYTLSLRPWSAQGIVFKEVEGNRLIVREIESINASGTSVVVDDVMLQLPVRSAPAAVPTCLTSDVIGVAQDGSLIRNNEIALYGVFGPETVVGYALDGFPIYGMSPARGDVCGGVITERGYGYFLSPDREEILHCFSTTPVPF